MTSLRVGIVAGEVSGDLLGARLIKALRKQHSDLQVIGVAGPAMQAAGCEVLIPMERLAIMGVVDIIKKLFEILRIRRQLFHYFSQNPPDVFIGVDAPDFNLSLERRLKKIGVRTVHYNSPTIWAWRHGRLKKIARSTDLMLTLFPFEATFYEKAHIPVRYVGHTLADEIDLNPDQHQARQQLGLPIAKKIVALLPGSRASELEYLSVIFLRTAIWCLERYPEVIFIVPVVNQERRRQFEAILHQVAPHLPVRIIDGRSREAMTAADVVLLASGTATLEAMLLKRPMVVAYRFARLNYWIARAMVHVAYFSLPNLLANKPLVPEFFQDAVTVENLGPAVLERLQNPHYFVPLLDEFTRMHRELRHDASMQAAKAILQLLGKE